MSSVNRLIQALTQYEGTIVIVSHDRHFVRQTANKIWWIEDHQIKEYPGTYDEFVKWDAQRDHALKKEQSAKPNKPVGVKQETPRNNNTADDKVIKKLKKEISNLESEIEELAYRRKASF
jgi:ATP-binding cassette subfamily F protein 3